VSDTVVFPVAITERTLADALARLGPARVERLAWSPFAYPERYIGDPDENVLVEDEYPMASLAAAIIAHLV
jgi:hypothetical protein